MGTGETTIRGLMRRAAVGKGEPGLDLICTKVAVDFQNLAASTADEQIRRGLQELTDACHADAVFVALLDETGDSFDKVLAGRSTFSVCNPEVLKSRDLADFPWIKSRLEHLRLLEIKDTSHPTLAQQRDAAQLASLNVGALLVVGFNVDNQLGGILGLFSATPDPDWSGFA